MLVVCRKYRCRLLKGWKIVISIIVSLYSLIPGFHQRLWWLFIGWRSIRFKWKTALTLFPVRIGLNKLFPFHIYKCNWFTIIQSIKPKQIGKIPSKLSLNFEAKIFSTLTFCNIVENVRFVISLRLSINRDAYRAAVNIVGFFFLFYCYPQINILVNFIGSSNTKFHDFTCVMQMRSF